MALVFLLVGGMAGILGWFLYGRPKPYHLVKSFPIYQSDNTHMLLKNGIVSCRDGVCLREDEYTFVLWSWRTGNERWRVITAAPVVSPVWKGTYCAASVSPDGHVLAAVSAYHDALRLQSWQDGQLLGEAHIPQVYPPGRTAATIEMLNICSLTTLDDGRCFVVYNVFYKDNAIIYHTVVIEKNRIIARYIGPDYIHIAPDGTSAMLETPSDFFLAHVAIEGSALRFTDRIQLPFIEYPELGVNGTVIGEGDGSIYRLSGQHSKLAGGWRRIDLSPGGRNALVLKDNRLRAVELATGKHWEMKVGELGYRSHITEDGKHILIHLSKKPYRLLSPVKRYLPRWAVEDREFLALYEHPGNVRAMMRIDPHIVNSWWPSSDGRSVAILTNDERCLLYRW